MNDLIRRALLGDREAQEECTKQGIVLPCPCCGGEARPLASDPFLHFEWWVRCKECSTQTGSRPTYRKALAAWNTRPAPPIGRCDMCAWCGTMGCVWDRVEAPGPDGYCSAWAPREEAGHETD